jgi:AAA domain-containing protein
MPTPTPFLPGFTRANLVTKRRLILSLEALEGAGKTRFTLTAPGPIAFINFDYGLEGVIEPVQSSKAIYVATVKLDFTGGKEKIIEAAEKELAKVETNYQTALRQARTIVIDTGSELWELLRLSAFGKLEKVMPHQYAEVNQTMTRLIKLAYDSEANLLLTHRLKEQWINDKRTGQYEFSGMKDIPFLVQAHARMWTDAEGYHLRVGKCRQNASVVGLELTNDMITFPTLAQFVFPDSTESDWV